MGSLLGVLGLFTLLSIAFAMSENRRAINIKTVVYGLIFQLIFEAVSIPSTSSADAGNDANR